MSEKDFIRFFDTALQYFHNNSFQSLNFVFLGGEPLLAFDNYKNIIPQYKNLFPKFNFEIVSNLTILSDEILRWLKNNHIRIAVSLDDLEHSKPFHNGEDTAPCVLGNITKLQKENIQFNICSVVDSAKIKTLIPLANYIKGLNDNVKWLVKHRRL
jgi:sulfatase maturation enzyme AslB (radical SAM superfamily)